MENITLIAAFIAGFSLAMMIQCSKRSSRVNKNFYKIGRMTGNSTRLVDIFVQDFFVKGECKVFDHYGKRVASKRVFELVLERLNREHGIGIQDVNLDCSRFIIRDNREQKQWKDQN